MNRLGSKEKCNKCNGKKSHLKLIAEVKDGGRGQILVILDVSEGLFLFHRLFQLKL